jgi:ABC-2 type transport system ATP-binding protein
MAPRTPGATGDSELLAPALGVDGSAAAALNPLEVQAFGRQYARGQRWAVRHVSFSVPYGSITALVGPNGSGKSTVMRACLGFERPDEGTVLVCGADPQRERVAAVGSVSYVPQGATLYRGLTIGDHVVMAKAGRHGFDPARTIARLGALGLDPNRQVGHLSGGEQAQVSLALALGSLTPLLVLDEPLAGLDPLARRDFLTMLVADVRKRGAAVLLSSHVVADVEQACDRICVLAGGQLVLVAEIAQAKRRYRTISETDCYSGFTIGRFPGPSGETLTLADSVSEGRPATLEEIVLGHLAGSRQPAKIEAPA